MALPAVVQVKLSSEAAEYVALTPVVVRELPTTELLEQIVGAIGMDVDRVVAALKRGTLVSGASRFRWQGWEAAAADVAEELARLPGPDPQRPFAIERCARVGLHGPAARIEIHPEDAARRKWYQRKSFLDALLDITGPPAYATYLYRERCDVFRAALDAAMRERVKAEAKLLPNDALSHQIRTALFEKVELLVRR